MFILNTGVPHWNLKAERGHCEAVATTVVLQLVILLFKCELVCTCWTSDANNANKCLFCLLLCSLWMLAILNSHPRLPEQMIHSGCKNGVCWFYFNFKYLSLNFPEVCCFCFCPIIFVQSIFFLCWTSAALFIGCWHSLIVAFSICES